MSCAIWIRLPHVSSNTAVFTGPISVGPCVNCTPSPTRRSYSACTSSTAKLVTGIPWSFTPSWYAFATGLPFGSSSSTPSGSAADATVIHRDPLVLSPPAARLATLPGGHPQGYGDCFDAFVADTYSTIRNGEVIFKADIISETPDVIYLEGVYVNPDDRNKGLGSRCLTQLCHRFLNRAQSIVILVNENKPNAHRFFQRVGFVASSVYDTLFLAPSRRGDDSE